MTKLGEISNQHGARLEKLDKYHDERVETYILPNTDPNLIDALNAMREVINALIERVELLERIVVDEEG